MLSWMRSWMILFIASPAEIESYANGAALIATTSKFSKDMGSVPVVHVMGFISGINQDALKTKILEILK